MIVGVNVVVKAYFKLLLEHVCCTAACGSFISLELEERAVNIAVTGTCTITCIGQRRRGTGSGRTRGKGKGKIWPTHLQTRAHGAPDLRCGCGLVWSAMLWLRDSSAGACASDLLPGASAPA